MGGERRGFLKLVKECLDSVLDADALRVMWDRAEDPAERISPSQVPAFSHSAARLCFVPFPLAGLLRLNLPPSVPDDEYRAFATLAALLAVRRIRRCGSLPGARLCNPCGAADTG